MGLHTRTTFGGSGHGSPNWQAASDHAPRRADAEFTLGLDEEWEDVPTAQLESSEHEESTADVAPPLPSSNLSQTNPARSASHAGDASASPELRATPRAQPEPTDRKSTRLNSSHLVISYAVFRLKTK